MKPVLPGMPESSSQKAIVCVLITAWLTLWVPFYLFAASVQIPYSEFWNQVSQGKVAHVTVIGDQIAGSYKEPQKGAESIDGFQTVIPSPGDPDLLGFLKRSGVSIDADKSVSPWIIALLLGAVPWLLIFFFIIKRNSRTVPAVGSTHSGFGKSRARLYRKSENNATMDDVAGLANARKELEEIIDFLKNPSKYHALGGRLPRGVLLTGPPGTGKTLMARAMAGAAEAPFFSISGSEFIEMFAGVGASRVRDMFRQAKLEAPSLIYIDEIDSIGRIRGGGFGGGNEEREQTLNQILAEMDGFSPQEAVVVIASTNRPDVLDPALVRPGRFDRRIVLDLPQKRARKEILEVHAKKIPLSADVDLQNLADRTPGFSGADLMNLINEAALLAARKGKKQVDAEDFNESREKIMRGIEREDLINDAERKIVAYHEAGHALLARLLPGGDPLRKVSIIPRGHSLGATEIVPEEDRHSYSRSYLLNRLAILIAGRVAERIIFNDVTTEASDDLRKASQLARRMVVHWGMGRRLGSVSFQQGEESYLGREPSTVKDFSDHTARMIDEEVQEMITDVERRAEEILKPNRTRLDALAEALLEQESLEEEEIDRLLDL